VRFSITSTNERERSRNAPIYDVVVKLAVGEALVFSADEWKGNRYPTQATGNLTALKSKDGRYPSYNWAFSKLGRQMVGKRFSVRLKEDGYVVIRKEDRNVALHLNMPSQPTNSLSKSGNSKKLKNETGGRDAARHQLALEVWSLRTDHQWQADNR
jgi:hypothetical protein